MKRYWLVGCFALFISLTQAEDEPYLDGALHSAALETISSKQLALIAPSVKPTRILLPPTETLAQANPASGKSTAHPILMVGYTLEAPSNLLSQARWQRVQASSADNRYPMSGWVARLELRSERAVGLRLQLQGRPHPQMVIHICDPAGAVVLPVSPYPDEEGKWWTPTLWHSDTIGIEVFVPDTVDAQQMPEIVAIGYFYTGIEPDFFPAALGCHLDVACYPAYSDIRQGVARILFPQGNLWFLCTGELLNRTGTDFAPIFMTAQHCINTQDSAHGMEAYWFYQTAVCNGAPPNLNSVPRTLGALLLKQHSGSDWSLLGLYEPPAGYYYFGWDSRSWNSGSNGSVVHHPAGSYKRLTFFTTDGMTVGCGFNLWSSQVYVNNGTVQGGSSGSAGIDSEFRVRGTASCVEIAGYDQFGRPIWKCPAEDDPVWVGWGRMDLAFQTIRWYIYNMANPTYVNRAVSGDLDNGGDTERGTSANPFNTVYEGTFCVPTGGTVRIAPGNYNERFRLWRPMRLERDGASGTVVIGRP